MADHRGALEQPLRLGRKAVDASADDGLHACRYVRGRNVLFQLVSPWFAAEHSRFQQRAYTLLQEKWISFCPFNQYLFECGQTGIIT